MPANNEGPKLQDVNALMQQMAGSQSAGAGSDDGNKNIFETITDGLATTLTRLLGKFGIKIRLRTLGATGVFKQFDMAGFAAKSVNEGAPSVNIRGGVIASIPTKAGFKMDWTVIRQPAIEGLPVVAMSYSSLGNLAPMDTGGGGGRGAIGLA